MLSCTSQVADVMNVLELCVGLLTRESVTNREGGGEIVGFGQSRKRIRNIYPKCILIVNQYSTNTLTNTTLITNVCENTREQADEQLELWRKSIENKGP